MPRIGQLNEKPLHAALKAWVAQPGDQVEAAVDGYVIDIVRDGLLLEIQTGNFAAIRSKLTTLLRSHRVRLIYPIAREKWIVKLPRGRRGKATRRKSPRRGQVLDLFSELVSIPTLLAHPGFSLEVLFIREEEVRRYAGKRHWRRQGWVIEERRLLEVVDRQLFAKPAHWWELLPDGLGEPFTARDLAKALGVSIAQAQKLAYCFRKGGIIELVGRRQRAYAYRAGVGVADI